MDLYIKNKFMSLKGSSKVFDAADNPVYIVKGKVFSISKKKFVCDLNGNRLFIVRNKVWSFVSNKCFIFDQYKEKVCKVVHKRFSFKQKLIVEGYKDEIRLEGDVFGFNFTILKNDKPIGSINREFNSLAQAFHLQINDENDATFMVALVIALDNIYDNYNKK